MRKQDLHLRNPTQKGAMGADDNFSTIQALRKGFGDTVQSIYKGGEQIFAKTFDDLSQGNLSKLTKHT